MLFEPAKRSQVRSIESDHPSQVGGRIGSVVTSLTREVDVVDVVEIVGLPLIMHVSHRLQDMAKNYMEPERALLRPRAPRA
jgi:hypothetical protein